jgi:pectinesterase
VKSDLNIYSIKRFCGARLRAPLFYCAYALLAAAGCATPVANDVPIISLIGDSTVTDNKGWGAAFANALSGHAVVYNHAASGRSAKSYIDEGRLPGALVASADYVFIQFGHNGQPGKGPHRETNPEGDYRDYLREFVTRIRATGAEPVIVSSLTRRNFDEAGELQPTLGPWAEGARAVAKELKVPFVNLYTRSIEYHQRVGRWQSARFDLEPGDHTHLNDLGASVVSGLIFDALADIHHPLAKLRPMKVQVGDNAGDADVVRVRTISGALGLAPATENGPFRIRLGRGRYVEKLIVDKPHVLILGEGQDDTAISWSDSGDSIGIDGKPVGTRGSYSVRVSSPDFAARNLTIENAFDYEANRALSDDDPARVRNPQGVALMLSDGSDRARFENVTFLGNQDTLFVDAGRAYFRNVRIVGHVDFIFGAGQAVFERANIEVLNRPGKNPVGYVTAPSTHISQPFGMLFVDCNIHGSDSSVPPGSVKLGRPWHPGANPAINGSAIFKNCFMDDSVSEDGYAAISSTINGVRQWFDLEPDSRFFEYRTSGPGALYGARRPQLDEQAARYHTPVQVLNGWNPLTEVW